MSMLETICRTFRQSSDANLFLGVAIVAHFFEFDKTSLVFAAGAVKQYISGHVAYDYTQRCIQRYVGAGRPVNEQAIRWVVSRAICNYCGAMYALREHRRNQATSSSPAE